MASPNRHVRWARRCCAGLAAVAVVAASLVSAGTAAAAAASSADCSGTASATPLVPFDTIAYSGTTAGVRVGAMFCPDPDAQAVQVVVLVRSTLKLVSNRGYATSQFAELGTDLPTSDSDLVIVTHPGNQQPLPTGTLDQLNTSLRPIGGAVAALWYFGQNSTAIGCSSLYTSFCEYGGATWKHGTLDGSSFTVIGIPGMPAGQAWRETAAQNGTADGRISGYLQKGTILNGGTGMYTVVNGPDPYVPVDTCFDSGCAVKVGGQTYDADSGASGLHVVELDRTTLKLIANSTVTTTGQLNSMLTLWLPVPPVGQYINATNFLNDQRLVIIQSVGDGRLSGNLSTATLQAIDQLGGTVDYLADAVTKGCRYALIGAASDLPWHATSAESSTAMVKPGQPCSNPDDETADQPTGHLYGVVQRDRDGLYTPSTSDAVGPTNVDLYQILYQPATAWPYTGDPGLTYVAENLGLCDPGSCNDSTVRSAYTNLNINFASLQLPLDKLDCTEGPEVCGTDFPGLKAELEDEFGWVENVRNLVTNLKSPYVTGGPLGPVDVKAIMDQVKNSVAPPPDQTATLQTLKIISGVMSIASAAAGPIGVGAKAVFGALGAAATLEGYLLQKADGGPVDSITGTTDELISQLTEQNVDYQEFVNHMGDILVSDYGKLMAVGTATKKNPSWIWTGDTTDNATTALSAGTRAAAYSALLPATWGGFDLRPGKNQSNSDDVTKFYCSEYYPGVYPDYIPSVETRVPFANALPPNQFHSISSFNSTGANIEVWTFAKTSGFANGHPPAAMMPITDLTDDIYGPDSTNARVGAYQYEASWWRSTYNPPSHVACSHLSDPDNSLAQPYSSSWPPPTIPPPLPS